MTDTIVAIATPPGFGGVGIVRVSGPLAEKISQAVVKKKLTPRLATFLPFYNQEEVLDQGIALFFKSPHSFTGEDVLELQAHGGPVVLDQLVKSCVQAGARLANPGEFSLRAFLNNKIDLAQAEALSDLIHANSKMAARSAVNSLQGEFSKQINYFLQQLVQLRMYVESAIDFPEEEIDFLSESTVKADLENIMAQVMAVFNSAKQGALLSEGLRVVIVGKPNAGKSSLLNALAQRDSAIVTDVAGTTRDVLTESIQIDGMPLHIVDTAGLHDSDDIVEREGINRAITAAENADVLIVMLDAMDESAMPEGIEVQLKSRPHLLVRNKIDLRGEPVSESDHQVSISVKENQGLDLLKEKIKTLAGFQVQTEGQFIARRRHLDALSRAMAYLNNGLVQLVEQNAGELLAEDLRLAQDALSEITGEFRSDDLLGEIFSTFCLGK